MQVDSLKSQVNQNQKIIDEINSKNLSQKESLN
jgi:hypothetical protein